MNGAERAATQPSGEVITIDAHRATLENALGLLRKEIEVLVEEGKEKERVYMRSTLEFAGAQKRLQQFEEAVEQGATPISARTKEELQADIYRTEEEMARLHEILVAHGPLMAGPLDKLNELEARLKHAERIIGKKEAA